MVRCDLCWRATMGPPSSPRQNYAVKTHVCCLCVITSSRDTDEQSERGRDRQRRSGEGVRGVVPRELRAVSMPLEKATALSRYRGRHLGSISSHGCSTRRPSPVNTERAWSTRVNSYTHPRGGKEDKKRTSQPFLQNWLKATHCASVDNSR